MTAYGVLSRGLLSGHWSKQRETGPADFRSHAPRFAAENTDRNLELVDALRAVAASKDATVPQVAIAWVLSRGDDVVPLVGARTRERLTESLGALEPELSADDLAAIRRRCPRGGGRRALRPAADGDPRQRALSRENTGLDQPYPEASVPATASVGREPAWARIWHRTHRPSSSRIWSRSKPPSRARG